MSATSFIWLGWMAGTTAAYWITSAAFRDLLLIGVTAVFLAVYSAESALILVGFTLITFHVGRDERLSTARLLLAGGVIVAVLVFYKLRVAGGEFGWFQSVAIPLGLSYYSFRCLHYLIERYKGAIPPHDLRSVAGYLFFLPTIIVGPIHRFAQYERDVRRLRWDSWKFSEGLTRIVYGYFKIMVLAVFLVSEEFGQFTESLFDTHLWAATYLHAVELTFYGYLMFAGYSDIAIGFGLLLGFRVMENFNWPFIRRNISEFWKCWHISLSSWVREYVYKTVFATSRNAALAAVLTMVIFGLWHEISFRYIAWGAYHGAGIALWQWFQGWKSSLPVPRSAPWEYVWAATSILVTFHFVVLSFVLVTEPDLGSAMSVYAILFMVS